MNTFVPGVAMISLMISMGNMVKFIRAKDKNGIATTLMLWVIGCVSVVLAAHTDWSAQIGNAVWGIGLDDLNLWSQIFLGLAGGSAAIVSNEFKKAIDSSDSAAKPPLIPHA